MSNAVIANIPGFGERYCSNNVEYELFDGGNTYIFFKKGTRVRHNEYGPAWGDKNENNEYWINNKYHRLSGHSCYISINNYYDVIGKHLGKTKEEFIKHLANVLIPKSIII